jgi:cytochrome c oxidase subunit IV
MSAQNAPQEAPAPVTTARLVVAWIALLALLALTVGSALVPLGRLNVVVNFAIATAKAGIVAAVFMELSRSASILRLAAAAGVVWLAILGGLAVADLLARGLG